MEPSLDYQPRFLQPTTASLVRDKETSKNRQRIEKSLDNKKPMVYTHLRSRDTQEEGMFSKNNVTTQHQNRRLFSINHDLINMTEIPRSSRSPRIATAKKSLRNRSNDDEESMSAHQKVSILKHAIGNLAESINQEFNILRQELIPSDTMLKQIKDS